MVPPWDMTLIKIQYFHGSSYMTTTVMATVSLSRSMWGAALLLEAAGVLSSFTWTFSCPAHCHPSVLPVFLSGFLGGIVIGFSLALWTYWAFLCHTSPAPCQRPSFPSRAHQLDCLRAYVHERP